MTKTPTLPNQKSERKLILPQSFTNTHFIQRRELEREDSGGKRDGTKTGHLRIPANSTSYTSHEFGGTFSPIPCSPELHEISMENFRLICIQHYQQRRFLGNKTLKNQKSYPTDGGTMSLLLSPTCIPEHTSHVKIMAIAPGVGIKSEENNKMNEEYISVPSITTFNAKIPSIIHFFIT